MVGVIWKSLKNIWNKEVLNCTIYRTFFEIKEYNYILLIGSMENQPLISVIIPCYNQAVYLPDALESLLRQTYNQWEAIIVNDGSPDNTGEVAAYYIAKDKRFKYIEKKNGGLSSARNAGISNSKGKFILPLDADDMIADTYIAEAISIFEKMPQVELVYCRATYFGTKIGNWDLRYKGYRELLMENAIFCSSVYRREDCLRIGGYDEALLTGFEDWDFYVRLLDEEKIVYQIPQELFFYRIKEVSMLVESVQGGNWERISEYIYQKSRDKYAKVFGEGFQLLRELNYYKRKEEKRQAVWWRRCFKTLKRTLAGKKSV